MGTIDMEGTQKEVSLLLQQDAKVGDYVVVHAGFAIRKIDEEEALDSLEFLRRIAAELDEKMGD
jgi:hydrogenase expression/formation protein HypC